MVGGRWHLHNWLPNTVKGARFVADDCGTKDGRLTLNEFMVFIQQKNPKVNQIWLAETLVSKPCLVWDAYVHYNHTYHAVEYMVELLDRYKGQN